MSKTYDRVLKPLTQPKQLGHAERNIANIQSLSIAGKQIKHILKGMSK